MRTSLPIAAVALFAACSPAGLRPVDAQDEAIDLGADIIHGEVIISADVSPGLQEELGLTQLDFDPDLGAGLYLAADDTNLTAISAALKAELDDVVVENNRYIQSFSVMNDPYYSLQWDMEMLDMEAAWAFNTGAGITVAVIDSGVSQAGEDTPVNFINGVDYVDGGTPDDQNGHGTHVAGTIAQASNNGKGTVGVAPDATILAIRALDANGSGSMYNVASAVTSAVNSGADVINMSLGSASSVSTLSSAIASAISKGVVVVAATGNEYKNTVSYPAAYTGVIAVGAVGADQRVSPYSNGGQLDVVAPGGNMSLDYNRDGYADGILQETIDGSGAWGYQFFEGTSMAAPHVAGIAALLLAEGASPYEIEQLLRDTAIDIEASGFDIRAGYGLVDPVAALSSIGDTGAPPSSGGSADVTAPTITNVAGTRSGSSMTLSWTTNEPTSTQLTFDTYGSFTGAPNVTSHSMTFTVSASTTYYFTITAVDAAGNTSTSGKWVMYP